MVSKDEFEKLRLWLDSEISLNHIYYWVILGAIVGGKFWIIADVGIAINIFYAIRRTNRLPVDYLRLKTFKNYREKR